MLVKLRFEVDGADLGETRSGAVPAVGERVSIEHGLYGRLRFRVVDVEHQYTDSGTRRIATFMPAPVIVRLQAVS